MTAEGKGGALEIDDRRLDAVQGETAVAATGEATGAPYLRRGTTAVVEREKWETEIP